MNKSEISNPNMPENSETTTSPVPLTSKKWLKVGLLGVAGLLLAVTLVYAGYWYGQESAKLKAQSEKLQYESQKATSTQATVDTSTTTATPTISWKTYKNDKYGFSFGHPNLNDSCCSFGIPESNTSEQVVRLADVKQGFPEIDAPFNGLSIYVELNPEGKTLPAYLEEEKRRLLSVLRNDINEQGPMAEYYKPILQSESSATIGKMKGVLLKGYTFWTADIYYVPFPSGRKILIISKHEAFPGSFSSLFDQTLSTLRFLE